VAPVFLLLVFGAMEISIMLHKASSVQWAIERAARAASLDAAMTESKMQALVDANLQSIGADVAVDIAYSTESGLEVVFGRVSATYVYPLKILFLPEQTLSFVTDVTLVRPAPT
jgi:Flp pilus assembly protein TadG